MNRNRASLQLREALFVGALMKITLAPPVRITRDDLDLVAGFRCGKEPHQQALADWLVTDALKALKDKTRIFAYATDEANPQIVGYGSLGKTKWQLTKKNGGQEPGQQGRVQIIPALAGD